MEADVAGHYVLRAASFDFGNVRPAPRGATQPARLFLGAMRYCVSECSMVAFVARIRRTVLATFLLSNIPMPAKLRCLKMPRIRSPRGDGALWEKSTRFGGTPLLTSLSASWFTLGERANARWTFRTKWWVGVRFVRSGDHLRPLSRTNFGLTPRSGRRHRLARDGCVLGVPPFW